MPATDAPEAARRPTPLQIAGHDNYNKPRQAFADTLFDLCDEAFVQRAETVIWLSAFANNNPRSDYHWQADACYNEAKRRGNDQLYIRAYNNARKSAGH